jgi:nucleoside-diphosphate-sugar epimerase
MNKKILITGGNGYLAKEIKKYFQDCYDVVSISRSDFDLSSYDETKKWFNDKYFDIVIHTAISGGSRLKEDGPDILDNNIRMIYNLIDNKNKFNKFVNFSSGAEIFKPNEPYGLSKRVISNILPTAFDNYLNIRIYAIFNENEIETRFIKSNIIRYIKKEPIIVHINKIMDFFYITDLLTIIKLYIKDELNCIKEIDCTYSQTLCLLDIAEIINNLSSHKVKIILENDKNMQSYNGNYNYILDSIPIIGLEQGIKQTYSKLERLYETN